MTHPPPGSCRYRFDRFLTAEEQHDLSTPSQWRWMTSLDSGKRSGLQPRPIKPIRHPQHKEWIARAENIHRPAHREVMLTLRGDIPYGYEGSVYRLRRGSVILFDHYESRDFRVPPYSRGFTQLWLHLLSRHLLTYNTFGADAEGALHREIPTGVLPSQTAAQLMDAWDQCRAEPGNLLCRELLRCQLSATLIGILGTATRERPTHHHQEVVASIQSYILDHLREPLKLNALARIAGYSPSFFHRIFLENTGTTPQQFLDDARLSKAKELLRANYTAEAVAEQIGIVSPAYFNRFFRKRVGLPPGQWSRLAAHR